MTTLLISLLVSLAAQAEIAFSLVRYEPLLAPGKSARCLVKDSSAQFGYRLSQAADGAVTVEMINEGKVTQENSKVVQVKDYGTPFMIFLTHFERLGESYGSHLEFVLERRVSGLDFSHKGSVMFTEAYFEKDAAGVEKEELKPVAKQALVCKAE